MRSVAHLTVSTYRLAVVQCALCMGEDRQKPVGTRTSKPATKRLAISLTLAIGALESNIDSWTGLGHRLLMVAARKKRLARMQAELAQLSGEDAAACTNSTEDVSRIALCRVR